MLKRICKNVTLPGVEGCLVVFILRKIKYGLWAKIQDLYYIQLQTNSTDI